MPSNKKSVAMDAFLRLMQAILGASVLATLLLTFVWPMAVSADPAHAGFKTAAIVTFVVFFVALAVLLAVRLAPHR